MKLSEGRDEQSREKIYRRLYGIHVLPTSV